MESDLLQNKNITTLQNKEIRLNHSLLKSKVGSQSINLQSVGSPKKTSTKKKIINTKIEYKFVELIKNLNEKSKEDKDALDSIKIIRERKEIEARSMELLRRKDPYSERRIRNIKNPIKILNLKEFTYDYQGNIIPIHKSEPSEVVYDPQ